MEQRLKGCLLSYMIQNTPEILMSLQSDQIIGDYLNQKIMLIGPLMDELIREENPPREVEKACMEALIEDLKPSKFWFVCRLLEKEFPHYYQRLKLAGTLTLEVTNIISTSFETFDTFGFSENSSQDAAFLFAIKEAVLAYFKNYALIGI